MDKIVIKTKQVTSSNLNPKIKSIKSELVTTLVERLIKTKKTIKKSDRTEKPQHTSIDVLLLIDEFKTRYEKLGEKAKEIAQKDGRSIVTYPDAEEALRRIRAENERVEKLIKI